MNRRRFLSTSAGALLGATAYVDARAEPIIDIHQHLGYSGRPDEVLLAHQQAMGVTTTLLLPAGRSVSRASTHEGVANGLQAEALGSGTICDNERYDPSVLGTVTDRLTGLQWEQKTDDASIHDTDDRYTWTAGTTAADGTAFTSFVATLNSGGCFAGQCDWRLPTRGELQTILMEGYPCSAYPCIDQATFGPTAAYFNRRAEPMLPTTASPV